MSISARSRKLLWGRAANRCSFPECNRELIIEVEATGVDTVVSNEAHIVAHEDNGPRANRGMPVSERDAYPNLILLCLEHHTVVDFDPENWPVDHLRQMKSDHERVVKERMSASDARELEHDIAYATIVTDWALRHDQDRWDALFGRLLDPTPSISFDGRNALAETRNWLLNRMWPGSRRNIDEAFSTLRRVTDDLATVIDCWFREWGELLWHRPVYKDRYVDNFDELAGRADWIVDLLHDVVFEVTRAANQVILEVSISLDVAFGRSDGFLTLDRQGAGFCFDRFVPRYDPDTYGPSVYPGLSKFSLIRADRDFHFGEGLNHAAMRDITPIRIGK